MNSIVSPLLFLAQTGTPEGPRPIWVELVTGLLPWVIVMVVVLIILRKYLSRYSAPLQDRCFKHMDWLEAKTDEMIELLKQINDKLDRPSS